VKLDLNNNKIHPLKFNVGIAANANVNSLEPEILKVGRKVKLGVDFAQTSVRIWH